VSTFQVSDVEELLHLMEQWGIAELHLTVGDATLDLQRAVAVVSAEAASAVPAAVTITAPVTVADAPELEDEAPATVTIHAPVVGIFRLAVRGFPAGGPAPGVAVQAGQVIGAIELMHVPTDLVSPVSGTIEAILVDEGVGVEYAQPLLVLRPFEEVSEDEAGMLPAPAR
jgi:biotin carboxyl carrier protein